MVQKQRVEKTSEPSLPSHRNRLSNGRLNHLAAPGTQIVYAYVTFL